MSATSELKSQTPESTSLLGGSNRGRSSSRKRQLSSSSEDQMKPPPTRQRSLSVQRQSKVQSSGPPSSPVTFKTHGESFNMAKLVQTTLLKPDVFQSIISEIKTELISELKTSLKSAITEAIQDAIKPLNAIINQQQLKITSLETENTQLKQHVDKALSDASERYEKFRNLGNAIFTSMAENKGLKEEVATLNADIEELEQYGRRTSLRFHNVPLSKEDLQKTDNIIVDIANLKLGISPPLCVNDINRSHIIGKIEGGKAQLICRFRNWKIKNSIYMSKKKLKNNSAQIFITEDLTRDRQELIKRLNQLKKTKRFTRFGPLMVEYSQRKIPARTKF
ncbi:unnamed protein product [Mytilus edulis]|uniref:Uncharacterized protein n=1 Tax=Mytilus edulis TaxID=6550 RepID=A0A8S3T738_MYTED|nr:unnamed protein product [Mytilus edulis]